MIELVICWLVLLACLAVLWLVTQWGVLPALLLCVLLMPLLQMPLHLLAAKKVRVSFQGPVNLAKNARGTAALQVENLSRIPLTCVVCRITVENCLTGAVRSLRVRTSVLPRGSSSVSLQLGDKYCGRLQLRAKSVRLTDCFGVIPVTCKQQARGRVTVQPDTFETVVWVTPNPNCPDDSEVYSQERPGYDLSETFQIREYQQGDSIRQVHWKLSQKLDRLIIRDPSLPVTRSVMVFWERTASAVPAHEETDAQAEVVVSVCKALLSQSAAFTMVWNEENCVMQEIRDLDELIGLLPRLLGARPRVGGVSGAELFLTTAGEAVWSHIVYVAGEVSSHALELQRLGRLTVLCSGKDVPEDDNILTFDPAGYADQLMELEI